MYAGMPDSRYPYALGDIFSDISDFAGKVGNVASTVQQAGREVSSVATGQRKVAVVPTSGSYATIPIPGQPYGVTVSLPLLVGGAALAVWLLARRR